MKTPGTQLEEKHILRHRLDYAGISTVLSNRDGEGQ